MAGITRKTLAIAALALVVFTGCSRDVDAQPTTSTGPSSTSTSGTSSAGDTRDVGHVPTTTDGGTTSTTGPTTTTTTAPEPEPFDFVSRTAYLDAGDWAGSGVIIDGTNLILTNAHVVSVNGGVVDWIRVSIASAADLEPVPMYWATVATYDPILDLAVLAVVEDLGQNAIDVELDGYALGDSDDVEIQDEISIAGFPGIGGTTISLTTGMVSGFQTEHPIGVRAWIKTDATIAGGNSGGPAFNQNHEVVAIPTQVGGVDCRIIADTNRDGVVDGQDSCVPVGGDLNLLRPVNFAAGLVEAAQDGSEYVSPYEQPSQTESTDDDQQPSDNEVEVSIESIVFAHADTPHQQIVAYPAGTTEVCVQAVVLGMEGPSVVTHEWFIDGESAAANASDVNGADRVTLERCLNAGGESLPNGTYELTLEIGDQWVVVSAGVGTGTSEVTFVNDSGDRVCGVEISASLAGYWGPNELISPLEPGQAVVFMVEGGLSDVRVFDCAGNELATVWDVELTPVHTLTYS